MSLLLHTKIIFESELNSYFYLKQNFILKKIKSFFYHKKNENEQEKKEDIIIIIFSKFDR